jgi:hypothetical protein
MTSLAVGGPGGAPPGPPGEPAGPGAAGSAVVATAADAARAVLAAALAPAGPSTAVHGVQDPGGTGVLAREALAAAAVEARAAAAAADLLRWLDDDSADSAGATDPAAGAEVTSATAEARRAAAIALAWQVPRGIAGMAGELAVAMPATAPAVTAALGGLAGAVNRAAHPWLSPAHPVGTSHADETAGFLVDGDGAAAALRLVAAIASAARAPLPDLAEALDTAAAGIATALPEEWAQGGPVRLAGLPHLLMPLGKLLCAAGLVRAALAPGAAGSAAVTARRYLYRHLRTVVPEGLTSRHLARTAELLDEVRAEVAR